LALAQEKGHMERKTESKTLRARLEAYGLADREQHGVDITVEANQELVLSSRVVAIALAAALLALPAGTANAESAGARDRVWPYVARPLAGRIDAGANHTCAILDDGTVHCWGALSPALGYPENYDSVGDDEDPSVVGAVFLGSGRTATALSTGPSHTCAILDDGNVLCWGDGSHGKLGYGNTTDIGDTESPAAAGTVDLGAGRTATAISAGSDHTCAILDDGNVLCWGFYSGGRLGHPYPIGADAYPEDIGDDETPASAGPVDIGAGRTATAIAADGSTTCAILDDASLRCWGALYSDSDLWVGDDETPGSVPPVNLGASRTAKAVTIGDDHVCAIVDDGTVRCWGYHYQSGELGHPGVTEPIGDDEAAGSLGPVDIGAGRTATSISASGTTTCVVLDDGTTRCWGVHLYGALGNPNLTETIGDDETPGSKPTIRLGSQRTVTAVATGTFRACALLDNGRLRCWGYNAYGQTGYANTDQIGDDEHPSTAGPVELGGLVSIAPSAPIPAATVTARDQITVSWKAPNPGSAALVSYQVTGPGVSPVVTTNRSVVFSKLPPGRYAFTVTATNVARTGPSGVTGVIYLY
jgi:alpha-tubulin suppressor-like RCC1 family protein